MKFYTSKLLGFDFFDRFWQQLQTRCNFTLCRAISASTKSVSIPNGMEFYRFLKSLGLQTESRFNSQRDGI
ncbi:hypothetical protein, partial [uncultured Campylobacter sp.]|uniref:hypothetical protein n=1 Tax=uncultured Campylobacter sp. TaxID=218934 RepID=UPI002634BD28